MGNILRAMVHGMYVGTTADMTRMRQLREQVKSSSTVDRAWKNTGIYMTRAMSSFQEQHSRPSQG